MCINKHLKAFALFLRNLLTCPKLGFSYKAAEMVCACRTTPFLPPVPRADLRHLGFLSCGTDCEDPSQHRASHSHGQWSKLAGGSVSCVGVSCTPACTLTF